MRYLQEAEEILDVPGPDHDEAVVLAVVRGIDREELKETVATMMWNKEWNLDTVSKILTAAVQKEVWDFDRHGRLAIAKSRPTRKQSSRY
ncbi:hypothetical protein TWF192_007295 [Orbilia oligospora]|uniref:Uncharacterized protein n=1 Tax=Orbilia oligospora TaxID=2813651 RepID=A0A6G1M5D7_ORBOL|nr:hypothetical protein TWF191_005858 [Orbilia oligospora]KAF3245819.1 hypothetical protein TWF192_007295 [Orbilia oligospora]